MKKYYLKNLFLFLILLVFLSYLNTKAMLPLSGKVISLDAGHGGKDPGTISGNIHEADINLSIVKYLEKSLTKNGATVILTRNNSNDLSSPKIYNRKRSDFDNRIKIINEAKSDMYISIHLNYLNNSSYFGPQVFYNKKNGDNKKIAFVIQKYLNNKLNGYREIKTIPKTYMFPRLNVPGVLIECGFLSNYSERTKLNSKEYQKKIAQYITEAIISYY